ncbi:hypothetical protein ACFE04_009558 [Oxalis oulophora]
MAPKSKPKPSTASQPPPAIEDLFTNLKEHIKRSEFQQVVKVADQVLAIASGDEDAIRCKVVALIKDDKLDEALSAIRKVPIDFSYAKAYCLYRQNKLDEALESLKTQDDKIPATKLLESQILYRLGRMDAFVEECQKLQKSEIVSLETNLVAALVSSGRSSEVQGALDAFRVKPTRSFQLAFNTACALIESNKYSDAEQLLLTARRIGQETLTGDNYAEVKLAPIATQLAYVQQILGQSSEAMRAYTDIINRNLADDSSIAVAVNNLISLKAPKEVSDGLKKLDKLRDKDAQNFRLSNFLELRLSPKHKEAIYSNRVLLLLHANKLDQARELVTALPDLFPDSVMPVLLQAALLTRENKAAKAEELSGQYADKFPAKSKVVLLARAQVAAAAGHHNVVADSLSKIPDIQYMPATIATIVALKERAGDINGAAAVLDSAVKWWLNAMTEDSKLNLIMQEAASFKLRHGKSEDAARLFEELVKSHGSFEALVGLVTTIADVDVDKAELYEKQLKPLSGLKGIDVKSLEKTSGAKHVEGSFLVPEASDEVKKKEKTKKKRKRKPKYPKGFVPANPGPPPDPKRWLPKRERSSYRPKRKDKRTAQVRGAQGSVSREKHDSSAAAPTASTSAPSNSKSSNSKEQAKPSKSSRKKSRN